MLVPNSMNNSNNIQVQKIGLIIIIYNDSQIKNLLLFGIGNIF
jgi:hypothetical protein